MRKGHVDKISHSFVAGWAADTSMPDKALRISVIVDGAHVADVVADVLRPDLAKHGAFGDGRHAFRYVFPEPLSPQTVHRVSVRYAADGALMPKGELVLAPAGGTADVPGLKPILVSGPGRSGTTLLMGLLLNAPEIVGAELLPYEIRLLAYYANAHHVLTHAADHERSTHRDKVQGDGFHIGFNPYNSPQHATAFRTAPIARDYADHYVPERLEGTLRDLVGEYYRRLAQDKGKDGARFFAEKNNNMQRLVREFTRSAFGAVREIVTIRDPRDMMCSQVVYFKSDPERAFAEISHAIKVILDIRAAQANDVYFNPYERLLAGDTACFRALSDFLQTEIVQRPDEVRQRTFLRHGTSEQPEKTVERWRTDMTPEWQERCNEAWRPFLETFGYEAK